MEAKKFILKNVRTKNSTLDRAYNIHINSVLSELDEENESRWEIYNIILTKLTQQTNQDYFGELKYRLTDGEDPNVIILDFLDRETFNIDNLVWFLKRRVEEFLDEDLFKRFF